MVSQLLTTEHISIVLTLLFKFLWLARNCHLSALIRQCTNPRKGAIFRIIQSDLLLEENLGFLMLITLGFCLGNLSHILKPYEGSSFIRVQQSHLSRTKDL